jgi:hypothetical protein
MNFQIGALVATMKLVASLIIDRIGSKINFKTVGLATVSP